MHFLSFWLKYWSLLPVWLQLLTFWSYFYFNVLLFRIIILEKKHYLNSLLLLKAFLHLLVSKIPHYFHLYFFYIHYLTQDHIELFHSFWEFIEQESFCHHVLINFLVFGKVFVLLWREFLRKDFLYDDPSTKWVVYLWRVLI